MEDSCEGSQGPPRTVELEITGFYLAYNSYLCFDKVTCF
jgi:hypothetical protein